MAHDVIVMHGSKREARNTELESRLDTLMESQGQYSVAFIESHERSICRVVGRLAGEGERDFNIIPLLFFSASHYSRDIPKALEHLKAEYQDMRWTVAPPVGTHHLMARFVEGRVAELAVEDVTIIVMAHGNEDYPQADRELKQLVANLDIRMPAHPATLYGELSVERLSEQLDRAGDFIIVPIDLEDGFLTGKMEKAVEGILPEGSITFAPSVNFSPILAAIIQDHMKLGKK
ncbi:sirohydrochlorin chelatase [Salinicoccus luteus]|uniref:sirohydrochlorin chelatase n=1 Tax=Salinicoccus luteus TaxID=367840 RepID=UPI0004E12E9E|nr:sirohydrochlorin chelatase [Salinicoccus luteus]